MNTSFQGKVIRTHHFITTITCENEMAGKGKKTGYIVIKIAEKSNKISTVSEIFTLL